MYNPFSLAGKHILVTGASSGIGRTSAIAFSKMVATLILVARNANNLQVTMSQLHGEGHACFICDLTDEIAVDNLINKLPKLNGVVHNAGVASRIPCKLINVDNYDEVFDLNTKATILLQAKLLSNKRINNAASIVFVASMAADYPSVVNAVYRSS